MRTVYFDNAATTRVHPEVVEAMLPYLQEVYGNAHSVHSWGSRTGEAIEKARCKVADLIMGRPEEIIFTANATEASNLAIKGLAQAYRDKGRHIIVSSIEHTPVLNSARTLEQAGFEVTVIGVDEHACVKLPELADSIREDTILVSIQHANGEVGTIQDMAAISELLKGKDILFHTDAESSAGIIPSNVGELGVDAMSLAANTFHGPKGAGALWLRNGVDIVPLIEGGIAENGRRAGTEDVAAIVGMGKACELAKTEMPSRIDHSRHLRDRLIEGLSSRIDNIVLTGHPANRLPRTASFCAKSVEGEAVLAFLDAAGIAAGSGAACASDVLKNSSHVLGAMGLPAELARGALLFTIGIENDELDIDYVIDVLPPIIKNLRNGNSNARNDVL
ncbi:MAG: cysteine desulfurase [Chloroflexi bacterium]|jgi:cysteine desulfurase|nr:cysteine desulfurase [Chloroflexota bacterium]